MNREARVTGIATCAGALVLLAGFLAHSKGDDGGWFAIALMLWIAGGAYTTVFGFFFAASLRTWWKVRR